MESKLRQLLCEAGIKHWEIYKEDSRSICLCFENDKIKTATDRSVCGYGLRIIQDGRIGFASSSDTRNPETILESARSSAKFGEKAAFEFSDFSHFTEISAYDPIVEDNNFDKRIETGKNIIAQIKDAHPEMKVNCYDEIDLLETSLWNSAGFSRNFRRSGIYYSIEGILVHGDSLLEIHQESSSTQNDLKLDNLVRNIILRADQAQKELTINTGELPVIFTPQSVDNLLMAFKLGLNGKMIQKGTSPLANKLGEKIISTSISLTDNAHLSQYPRCRPWDAEGMPTRPAVLIEQGVVKRFVYDLQTAGLMGETSTAGAVRSYNKLPAPGYSTLLVKPGHTELADMIKGIKEGVLVDQVLGGGQSNLLMGEFSLNLDLGYKIEDGEIVGRIKNAMVAGNAYQAFGQDIVLGRCCEYQGGFLTPPILFPSLSIAGK